MQVVCHTRDVRRRDAFTAYIESWDDLRYNTRAFDSMLV